MFFYSLCGGLIAVIWLIAGLVFVFDSGHWRELFIGPPRELLEGFRDLIRDIPKEW